MSTITPELILFCIIIAICNTAVALFGIWVYENYLDNDCKNNSKKKGEK